jgi:hypothetical protein
MNQRNKTEGPQTLFDFLAIKKTAKHHSYRVGSQFILPYNLDWISNG